MHAIRILTIDSLLLNEIVYIEEIHKDMWIKFDYVTNTAYTVWVKKKFTPRKLLIILKIIYEQ